MGFAGSLQQLPRTCTGCPGIVKVHALPLLNGLRSTQPEARTRQRPPSSSTDGQWCPFGWWPSPTREGEPLAPLVRRAGSTRAQPAPGTAGEAGSWSCEAQGE